MSLLSLLTNTDALCMYGLKKFFFLICVSVSPSAMRGGAEKMEDGQIPDGGRGKIRAGVAATRLG